jgi:hypothetical protein
MAIPQVVL